MTAETSKVQQIIDKIGKGLTAAEAGKQLKAAGVVPVERATQDENLIGGDITTTPGSITEVYAAQARGQITSAQEAEILAAYTSD